MKEQQKVKLPNSFLAAGISAGIKKHGAPDLALLVSEKPATAAGVFTTNAIKAASVKISTKHLKQAETAHAIIINSGNANACTGEKGLQDAQAMAEKTAGVLACPPEEVFVCSTGHIGDLLPMDKIEKGIESIVSDLSTEGVAVAAEAMMTTDTCSKTTMQTIELDGVTICITGLAKGSGMIEPNMATMLAAILTDASVDKASLQQALIQAVNKSFNRISVDGDKSTNDTVLILANSSAGNDMLSPAHSQWDEFCAALEDVCFDLAMQIIGDGEGAHKIVTVEVLGANTDQDAEKVARAVANSLLVKTSWVNDDANWGRLMDAVGYAGAAVEEDRISIHYDDQPAVVGGVATDTPVEELQKVIAQPAFTTTIDLHIGSGEAIVYSCECTEEYVKINV